MRDELPHSIAVTVEEMRPREGQPDLIEIFATLHLERDSQKGIVIGAEGARLKAIGTDARAPDRGAARAQGASGPARRGRVRMAARPEEARPAGLLDRCSRNYRAAFRAPGSAAFSAAGFVMRLPIAIYPLGLILSDLDPHRTTTASPACSSGVYMLGGAAGNPLGGRLVDRDGQRRVLCRSTAVHVAAAAVLVVLARERTRRTGRCCCRPSSSASATCRSVRWCGPGGPIVLDGRPELATAYSFESTARRAHLRRRAVDRHA